MTRRIRPVLVTAAAAALALTGCTAADTASGEADAQLEPITVLYAAIAYEPLVIAEQNGYFEEVGLDVTVKRGGAPQDNIAQALGGSADIIVAAWDTVVTSTAEGMPIEVVAGNSVVSDTIDTSGVLVREGSGHGSLADLKGGTVAFDSLGAGGTIEFYGALAEAGLSRDDVTAVAIPYAGMGASLEQGQVDAVFPSEPFYSQLTADPQNVVIANPVRETRADVPITLWAASSPWLAEHGEEAAAFLEALQRGIEVYEDPANLDTVLEVRAEIAETSVDEVSTSIPPMRLAIDEDAVTVAIDQVVAYGTVTEPKPLDEILWAGAPRR
ncbi:ABC transporter substrate-binding protein [Microbacterium sp. GXF7504]